MSVGPLPAALITRLRSALGAGALLDTPAECLSYGYDNSPLQATPAAVMKFFQERHGVPILTAWGSTECAPLATLTYIRGDQQELSVDDTIAIRVRQGIPAPAVERKVLDEDGRPVPWDDTTMGEVYVRGPWIATTYIDEPRSAESFIDGWWKSGDIATVDRDGVMKLVDRAKDLIKSGGEWISSVDLENSIMAVPGVAEAAVIAVFHPKWQERPLACVVKKPGAEVTKEQIYDHLLQHFAKWWMPDDILFIDAVPKTSVGKFDKKVLREQFKDFQLPG